MSMLNQCLYTLLTNLINMRVFIVDDSPSIVNMLSHYFERRGDAIAGYAYDVNTAIEKSKSVDFDLLIMDYKLNADITGYDLAQKIQKIKKNVKIIMITSDDTFSCDDFPIVRKPFNWSDFESTLTAFGFEKSGVEKMEKNFDDGYEEAFL